MNTEVELDPTTERNLVLAAIDGMRKSYTSTNSPDDRRFGAAVLTTEGNIYPGGGYHSDTYTLILHAEQSALAHAANHGQYQVRALAVTCSHPDRPGQVIYPCHMCKQLLWENYLRSKINMQLIMHDREELVLERVKLLDMMSHPWPPNA